MILFLSILGIIVIFEHVLYLVLVSFLLVLNVYLPAGSGKNHVLVNMCLRYYATFNFWKTQDMFEMY